MADPIAMEAGWRWQWHRTRSGKVVVMNRENSGTADGWVLYNAMCLQESCFPSGSIIAQEKQKCSASGSRAQEGEEMDPHQNFLHNLLSLSTSLPSHLKRKKKSWSPSFSSADYSGSFSCVTKKHLISELF